MNTFDQVARLGSKLDGAGFHAWLMRCFQDPEGWVFDRWADARRIAAVPGLERIDDVVAVLRSGSQEAYLITEMETEPRRQLFKRLGVYQLLLSLEVSTGGPKEEPPVGIAVLTLTGKQEQGRLQLGIPGLGKQTSIEPLVLNLSEQVAQTTLGDIEAKILSLAILPWLPLMAGGSDPALIVQWKKLAELETDLHRRTAYGHLALVFAELTPGLVNWQRGLEGWQMRESKLLTQWMNEGEVKAHRRDVLALIKLRLANPVPEDVRLAIEGTNDPDILRQWHSLAATSEKLSDFVASMKQPTAATGSE